MALRRETQRGKEFPTYMQYYVWRRYSRNSYEGGNFCVTFSPAAKFRMNFTFF